MLHMDQLAIYMLVVAPAVFIAVDVGNDETSTTLIRKYPFDDVRIKAVSCLHLVEDNIV